MVRLIILFALAFTLVSPSVFAEVSKPYRFVHCEYMVKGGDTLANISRRFMGKNTYGLRNLKEFQAGIIEINPSLWETKEVSVGEKIWINWFEAIKCEDNGEL